MKEEKNVVKDFSTSDDIMKFVKVLILSPKKYESDEIL